MMKGIIFIIITSLMSLTAGISYSAHFDCNIMVLAEEEERSSQHSLDEINIKLCSARLSQPYCSDTLNDGFIHEKYTKPYRMYWSSANINIHDIPPERFS